MNFLLPQILMYCNIIYSKYGLKPFMTISFCGLTLLEGTIIMSRCTSITAGISKEQAFTKELTIYYLHMINNNF